MHSTVAVQDLKIGMFIRLDLSWMSHPFPLSNFKITNPEQIATIRGLGLKQVRWVPERSDVEPARPLVTPLHAAAAAASSAGTAPSAADLARTQRRDQLAAERAALQQCEARFDEAAGVLQHVNTLLVAEPHAAATQAQGLAQALLDKMMGDGDLCIRLLSSQSGDRLTAHALNVTVIAALLGRSMGLPSSDLLDLTTGALLHDIGKIDLPARVHHLEDGFTSTELKAYREHVTLGVARARLMGISEGALQVLAQHHEMADGSGFPNRLPLDAQAPAARLVALVNRYDKLCNPGPRGIALTPHEAVSVLFAQSRNKFDMPMLSAFIRMMGVYPAGSVVQLTDDRFALVMQVNSSRPLKPRVLVHDPKLPRDEALLLDLERQPNLGIRRSIAPAKLPPTAAAYLAPRPRVTYFFDSVPPGTESDSPAVEVVQ